MMTLAVVRNHLNLASDINNLVTQQENLTMTVGVTGLEEGCLPNVTQPPYYNLTLEHKQYCEDYRNFCSARIYIDVCIIAPLCLAGIVGNFLAILTLRLDHSNRTMTFLLQALAVADNSYLVSSLLVQTLKSVTECSNWLVDLKEPYQFMEPYLWPLASIAQTTTVWLTVLVTLDRYVAICTPFQSMRQHVNKRTKKAVYMILIAAFLYNIPRFFEKVVRFMPEHCFRVCRYVARPTWLRNNELYKLIYKTILFFIFRMVGPLGILLMLNVKLIQALRRARRDHAQLTQTANQCTNNYFNLILVTVVTVFIICQTPDLLLRIAMTISTYAKLEFRPHWPNMFSNMMLTVNSSVNCLIYCLAGRRFRLILFRMLWRPQCPRQRPHNEMRCGNTEVIICSTYNKRHVSFSAVNETIL